MILRLELWWLQVKSFLRTFAPTTTEMVDTVISVALNLMNPKYLKKLLIVVSVPLNSEKCCNINKSLILLL